MRLLRLLAVAALATLTGCHSAFIDATLRNRTGEPLSLVELDYPSASFGIQTLAPGQDFHYRFKVIGSGPLKLIYTDTKHLEHDISGPSLKESDEGTLTITVTPSGVDWSPVLKPHS